MHYLRISFGIKSECFSMCLWAKYETIYAHTKNACNSNIISVVFDHHAFNNAIARALMHQPFAIHSFSFQTSSLRTRVCKCVRFVQQEETAPDKTRYYRCQDFGAQMIRKFANNTFFESTKIR